MNNRLDRNEWAHYLSGFNKRNQSRLTWLQVFGDAGAQSQEDGLSLEGISLEERGVDAPRIQIMLGGHNSLRPLHLTRAIANVASITPQVGVDGGDEAIEFIDNRGEANLLVFKHPARLTARPS